MFTALICSLITHTTDAKELKCLAPKINGGTISPTSAIPTTSNYSVTCDNHYSLKGPATIYCIDKDGEAKLSEQPTCKKGKFLQGSTNYLDSRMHPA